MPLKESANESEKDYWPIMEILTAYVRKNSRIEIVEIKKLHISMDIQANESTESEFKVDNTFRYSSNSYCYWKTQIFL